jgi:hypothetical protein
MRGVRRIRGLWLALALLMAPAISPALAQPSGDDLKQWQELIWRAVSAYQAGKYVEGLKWAQQAFTFAEQTFGLHSARSQHPRQPQQPGRSLREPGALWRGRAAL